MNDFLLLLLSIRIVKRQIATKNYPLIKMQDILVSGGVESEAAEAVCAQCGARLVSSSSLEQRQDLLEFHRNKRGR